MASLGKQILRRKPVLEMEAETGADSGESELARTIGLFQLSMFGVGQPSAPASSSFSPRPSRWRGRGHLVVRPRRSGRRPGRDLLRRAGGAVPVSGSSYSYAYATLGELRRWVWPRACSSSTACRLPPWPSAGRSTSTSCSTASSASPPGVAVAGSRAGRHPEPAGGHPVFLCTLLLIRGASESAKTNAVMVLIKLGVLVLFIVLGVRGWNSDNFQNFAPFGIAGITSAAGIIFFSYIGLDAVSTAGEEVKDPHRTCPWPSSSPWSR